MNFLSNIKFFWQKPKVVIVTGAGRKCAKEAIGQILNQNPATKKEVVLLESDLKNEKELNQIKFFINKSSLSVLVVAHVGDIPPDKDFFAGEKEATEEITKLAKFLPPQSNLILNFDDETAREIADITNLKTLTFGFQPGCDFRVSDVMINGGTNFKVNYKGNIVPIWLDRLFGKEQIYSALSAVAVGIILDLNLVEISQALKNYHSLSGKMRLIRGIKNSWILDDSESATVFSMTEALEILGKIKDFERKIAVLGDILDIGKYTIEAHETIGEKAAANADLLFTVGSRAKFIAEGARQKRLTLDKIFQYDTIQECAANLKKIIEEGDAVLVDGSKEMNMSELVKEIKAV
jgi:UDP-N-acetylmuramoyl-tripeptide--D-alanyl-D-alanine ligase